jgi:hypothetical protein
MSKVKLLPTLPQQPKSADFSFGGVTIRVTRDGNVTIKGAKNLSVKSEDFSVDAKRISLHAEESLDVNVNGDIYLGSSTHVITQAPRIDHNPKKDRKSGYKIADEIKKLIRTFANYYPSWRDPKGMYVEQPPIKHACKCGKCDASKS